MQFGLNVAFYDAARGRVVGRDVLMESVEGARALSLKLAELWKTGSHGLPSEYWVVWESEPEGYLSVFCLDETRAEREVRTIAETVRARIRGRNHD